MPNEAKRGLLMSSHKQEAMGMVKNIYLIRRSELKRRIGYCDTIINEKIHDGILPPPVSLGGRAVLWVSDEIDTVLSAIISGKTDQELKSIVKHIVADRKKAFKTLEYINERVNI